MFKAGLASVPHSLNSGGLAQDKAEGPAGLSSPPTQDRNAGIKPTSTDISLAREELHWVLAPIETRLRNYGQIENV